MKSSDRLNAIRFIWVAFAAACIFTLGGEPITGASIWLALVYALAAVGGTVAVAVLIRSEPEPREAAQAHSEKLKHEETALFDHLIASMSDTELAALRRRLEASESPPSDGEFTSLDELLKRQK